MVEELCNNMYHRHTKIGQWKNQEIWKESIFIGCVVNEEGMHFKQPVPFYVRSIRSEVTGEGKRVIMELI